MPAKQWDVAPRVPIAVDSMVVVADVGGYVAAAVAIMVRTAVPAARPEEPEYFRNHGPRLPSEASNQRTVQEEVDGVVYIQEHKEQHLERT